MPYIFPPPQMPSPAIDLDYEDISFVAETKLTGLDSVTSNEFRTCREFLHMLTLCGLKMELASFLWNHPA